MHSDKEQELAKCQQDFGRSLLRLVQCMGAGVLQEQTEPNGYIFLGHFDSGARPVSMWDVLIRKTTVVDKPPETGTN
jgi:hypothetical protein